MFIFYTLLYIILTYLAFAFSVINAPSFLSLIRESYFVYLIILAFYKFAIIDKWTLKISNFSKLLFACVLLAIPYIFISSYFSEAIVTYVLYFSGPILFLLISYLNFSEKTRKKLEFYFFIVMGVICVLNIGFYFVQDIFVAYLPAEKLKYFIRTKDMRYLGIAIHPTTTGFYFIYFISYIFLVKHKKISSLVVSFFYFLTGTRSAILGFPFYLFLKFKKILKILALIFGISFLVVVYFLLLNGTLDVYLDGSALKHLMDLFVLGPEYIIKYPWGAGLGTVSPYNQENSIVHIESEMYLYMIQLGFIPFILKMIFYFFVIKKLLQMNTRKTDWLLFILLTFLIGCMVFALNDTRFIANFIWIMLGIEFSKPEYKYFPRKIKKSKIRKYIFKE